MTDSSLNHSLVAIIEIDSQGYVLAANNAAKELFSVLNNPKLKVKFDYNICFNLPNSLHLNDIESLTVVINQQNYFLQIFIEEHRTIFVVQPVAYLKSKLNVNRIPYEQAFDTFIAKSASMQKLIEQAKAFSRQREPLLISGATGTGKDLLALACHKYSQRGDKTFLALNCAALPDEVVESELYGHAPGAYPGVVDGKKGFFEQANGGSVLLDGIDEMSPRMQTKLLRFINDGTFRRVGDDNEVNVDVRVICATKENLYSLVEQGRFREDLYYRLNVLSLHIPPLSKRKEDIILLTEYFVTEFANKQGKLAPIINNDVIQQLQTYVWPGNIRELKNILYSALAQLKGNQLTSKEILLPIASFDVINSFQETNIIDKNLDEIIKQFEAQILTQLYKDYPSTRKLSKRLGISHTAVANKLREYSITK